MKPRVVIIGGGIAGLSCGAAAASDFDVTVLEAELQPGYHSSGRSAAVYIEAYVNEVVHALSLASAPDFQRMGARPLGAITIADRAHEAHLDTFMAEWQARCPTLIEIDRADALRRVPILRSECVHRAVLDPNAMPLDTGAMLDGYRRSLLAAGGRVINNARVASIEHGAAGWRVGWEEQNVDADVLVNAAGAWADDIARLAGVRPLGLQPYRRTALLVDPGRDASAWPMVHRAQGGLYFKPEGGLLMVSLADETPCAPYDAQPEELDVATAVERLQESTTLEVGRLHQTWAGLRTFLPDRYPAVGYDGGVRDFFWLAGQGGFGMQTAPALSRIAADLLAGRASHFAAQLSPERC